MLYILFLLLVSVGFGFAVVDRNEKAIRVLAIGALFVFLCSASAFAGLAAPLTKDGQITQPFRTLTCFVFSLSC